MPANRSEYISKGTARLRAVRNMIGPGSAKAIADFIGVYQSYVSDASSGFTTPNKMQSEAFEKLGIPSSWWHRPSRTRKTAGREWAQRIGYDKTKQRAQNVARSAVYKGILKKPDGCSLCGRRGKNKIEMHHEDYSKPLEVVWLCHRCHTRAHSQHNARRAVDVFIGIGAIDG